MAKNRDFDEKSKFEIEKTKVWPKIFFYYGQFPRHTILASVSSANGKNIFYWPNRVRNGDIWQNFSKKKKIFKGSSFYAISTEASVFL